ncbi:hypothetical protein Adt_29246 [Abeliophyllum distichum]|uniref:Uncharacterized protein n=1 Tax=Abeliophyllum distichum TaxID=126358 RepID=A0ABD1R7U1_9LAMI
MHPLIHLVVPLWHPTISLKLQLPRLASEIFPYISIEFLCIRILLGNVEHLYLVTLKALLGKEELGEKKHKTTISHNPIQINSFVLSMVFVRPLVKTLDNNNSLVCNNAVV